MLVIAEQAAQRTFSLFKVIVARKKDKQNGAYAWPTPKTAFFAGWATSGLADLTSTDFTGLAVIASGRTVGPKILKVGTEVRMMSFEF